MSSIQQQAAQVIAPVEAGNKDQRIRMHGADDVYESERPRLPLRGCDSSMSQRIEGTVFMDQWMRIVGKAVMRFVEDVIEDCRFVTISGGEQKPEIERLQIGEGSNKVAVSAKRAIGVKPLQVEQRVSTGARCPTDHSVEVFQVIVCAVSASTI